MRKFGGVFAPRQKTTAACAPEVIPIPPEVKLSMSMPYGTAANPVVKVGDNVKVGQVIGEAGEAVSSPVHASVSGTIKSIDVIDSLSGEKSVTVTITSDGSQTPWEGISPPIVTNLAGFLEAVKNSGASGCDDAGCPMGRLVFDDYGKLDYLLVNCLESEPYISSGTRTIIDDAKYLWEGVKLLKEYLKPKGIIICIENDNAEPVKIMRELSAGTDAVEILELPPRYPQGQKKVLAYTVTGRVTPEGGCLSDAGCFVISCTVVAAIAKYIKTGVPLVAKCVTVDGPAVNTPKNLVAPIGTPVSALFDYCGGLKDDVKKIILGGPMKGQAIPNVDVPIGKSSGAVLAFSGKMAEVPEELDCIKCGRCVAVCPMRLMPSWIEKAFLLKKTEQLRQYKVNLCVECGCCAYKCPAKRPLAQVMSLSKGMLETIPGEAKQ